MTTKQGTIYQLGEHLLACGDSTNKKLVNTLINDHKINLILCDPPFGVAVVESKESFKQSLAKPKKIIGDELQTESKYTEFTKAWLSLAKPHMAKKNSVYIFNSDKMIFALREGMQQADFKFAQLLIWAKTHAVIGRMDYLNQHELLAYGWCGIHKFYKSKDKSILVCPKPSKSKLHPTMKPLSLLRRLILNSSRIGDTVYDPFGGSGSSLISCENTKRKCIMIEIDEEYCQTIITRWENLTGNKAIKLK